MAVATFGPGTTTGIPISGTLGGGTIPVQGAQNTAQNTATTNNQYLLANNPGGVLGAATSNSSVGGGTAGPSQAQTDYNNLKGTTLGSIGSAIGQGAQGYHSSILDYLDQRRQQQNQIDSEAIQNELDRQQGGQGILDMVGTGIRSGGVQLANANAGTSSAG